MEKYFHFLSLSLFSSLSSSISSRMSQCVLTFSVREAIVAKEREKKKKEKIKRREKRKRDETEFGEDNLPPKQKPKTIESMREPDETFVVPDDSDVLDDVKIDEFADYFSGEIPPKLLVTTGYHGTSSLLSVLSSSFV